MEETIDISGIPKGELLAALYNNSKTQGMGILHFTRHDMTVEEANDYIDRAIGTDLYFDYLKGRVMKVSLGSDNLSPWLYDRDIGQGEAKRVVETLRAKLGVAAHSQLAAENSDEPEEEVERVAAAASYDITEEDARPASIFRTESDPIPEFVPGGGSSGGAGAGGDFTPDPTPDTSASDSGLASAVESVVDAITTDFGSTDCGTSDTSSSC